MKIQGWINFYMADGELRIQPMVHDTKEEAVEALHGTLGHYQTPHLKFVCDPVRIDHEVDDEAVGC